MIIKIILDVLSIDWKASKEKCNLEVLNIIQMSNK